MTVRRLVVFTFLATALLATALAANVRADANELSVLAAQVSAAVPEPPVAIQAEANSLIAQTNPVDLAPTETPTPLPAPVLAEIVDIKAPTLVEIPADLIATPTPEITSVPLPFLTNIASTPRDNSVVYLTFDDGPDPVYTNQILDVLASYGAKATFFVIGNSTDTYPEVVQRIVAEGHTIANHTYYHEALTEHDQAYVTQTLDATSGAMARATGRTSNCLRPPYGAMDRASYEYLTGQGWVVHMWEVDSQDWQSSDSYAIAATVLSETHLGDRVLFHDGPSNRAATVAALDSILQVLSTRGVQFHALNC